MLARFSMQVKEANICYTCVKEDSIYLAVPAHPCVHGIQCLLDIKNPALSWVLVELTFNSVLISA